MTATSQTPNSNERLFASLANASVLISLFTGIGGALAAALIWALQKDKSPYVAFQALQAVVYQLIGVVVFGLAWCCWLAFYMVTSIPMIPQLEANPDTLPPIFWIGMLSMVCPMMLMGAWALFGLWAALQTYMGKNFRYPVIAGWVERMGTNPAS